jgi:acetylornithine/N-succinyldiaminopimelate aminotransferase
MRANRLAQGLAQLKDEFPGIVLDVRGKGLLAGVKLAPPVADVVKVVIGEKLLAVGAGENVLRILPPLNVSDADIAEGLARLRRAFAHLSVKS